MPTAEWGVLIADDEPAARRGVRQLLAAFPEFAVIGECRDGAEVLASLDVLRPDVVFLDVQMPGLDGFEVIRRRTPERMPAVVFLTAYDQFAIRAFEAQALDYLLKPVSEARFAATMKRLVRQFGGAALRRAPSAAASARGGAGLQPGPPGGGRLPAERGREPAIVVTTARGVTVIRAHEIDWIEAADNYARIWIGARSYLLRESLHALERRVGRQGFARAHRCAVVRLDAVKALRWTSGGGLVAVLRSGATIPVSRRRRAAFAAAVRSRAS